MRTERRWLTGHELLHDHFDSLSSTSRRLELVETLFHRIDAADQLVDDREPIEHGSDDSAEHPLVRADLSNEELSNLVDESGSRLSDCLHAGGNRVGVSSHDPADKAMEQLASWHP